MRRVQVDRAPMELDAVDVALYRWMQTKLAAERLAATPSSRWVLTRRSPIGRRVTIATFPLPATVTTADEADRWSELARAVSLELSHRSWLGVQFAPVTAGATTGVLVSLLASAKKVDQSTSAWLWMTSLILAMAFVGLVLFGAWALWSMGPLRASYHDSPLWRERSADYERRAEVLRRARQEPPVSLSVSAWARPWRRRAPR